MGHKWYFFTCGLANIRLLLSALRIRQDVCLFRRYERPCPNMAFHCVLPKSWGMFLWIHVSLSLPKTTIHQITLESKVLSVATTDIYTVSVCSLTPLTCVCVQYRLLLNAL